MQQKRLLEKEKGYNEADVEANNNSKQASKGAIKTKGRLPELTCQLLEEVGCVL